MLHTQDAAHAYCTKPAASFQLLRAARLYTCASGCSATVGSAEGEPGCEASSGVTPGGPTRYVRVVQAMTRLEHSSMDGKRQVAGQRSPSTTNQPTSLGPVDPSWLAKLSGQLGIQPARTVAPLLMSIWPGVHAAAICCREACAYLMQVCSYSIHAKQPSVK